MNTPLTVEQIQRRAQAGEPAAQVMLARLFDQQGRHDQAMEWLERAALGGDLAAGTVIGVRWLVGRAAPFEPARGAAWIHRTAGLGGAEASARSAVLTALGHGVASADWPAAFALLRRAATVGDPAARGQLAAMGAAAVDFSLETWLTPPKAEIISEAPKVQVLRGFASAAECDWLRQRSGMRLDTLRVYDPATGQTRPDPMRTSRGAGFGLLDTDLLLTGLRERMSRATGLDVRTFEPANVLNYQVGQQYEPHYDFINPEEPGFAEVLARQGQRMATALIYLNEDYEGGETRFPELDWAFKAQVGDALIFFSVDAAGQPDTRSLHAGLPPTRGEKWLLSQWIRDRPQPIV